MACSFLLLILAFLRLCCTNWKALLPPDEWAPKSDDDELDEGAGRFRGPPAAAEEEDEEDVLKPDF